MVIAVSDLVGSYGARVALVLALVIVLRFLQEMLKVRLLFYRLRKQGLVCYGPWTSIIPQDAISC